MSAESPDRQLGTKAPDHDLRMALGVVPVFVLTLPAILAAVIWLRPTPPPGRWDEVAARLGIDPSQLVLGEVTFRNTCALCHGRDANGMPRLGKPLRNSEFVQSHKDDELLQVVLRGRLPSDPANTTGAAMPPRAGNPALAEDRIRNVIYYLRTLQEPGAPYANLDAWIVDTAALAATGLGGIGHETFIAACSACHGPNAEGMEGLGKPLGTSSFVASKTDAELMAFIKTGRPIWDADNTTGVDMPPKGGNPALSDEELKTIIGYLRALHEQAGGPSN
ncbi:MAG: c-type cytochrome [Phycisphaerales bacterium]|nr:c-type cytochrome [Phycisphaerales bacterium]